MNQLLHKVFPLLSHYFAKEGLSATMANAKKNENTNQNANLSKDIQTAELYETHLTIVSDKGTQSNKVSVRKLKPSDFSVLDYIAKNNGENALLGNGIKIFNQAMERIRGIEASKLTEWNGGDVSLPQITPLVARKSAVLEGNIDSVVQMERVEDILSRCQIEVLERLDSEMVKKALKLESEAATLGNELTKRDSFLQRIIAAEPDLQSTETVANFALVIKQPKLAYSEAEIAAFKTLFIDLQARYLNIQGQLNGIKKTIKDTLRLVESEFAKEYEARLAQYQKEQQAYMDKVNQINAKGEVLRQELLKELLTLKIQTA